MKNIVILGSTGSIGTQTLEVTALHPDRFRIVGLAAGSNARLLHEQAVKYNVKNVALADKNAAANYEHEYGTPCAGGSEAVNALAALPEADIVVASTSGTSGLASSAAAIRAGKTLALANKETLVSAGVHITALAREHNVKILPVDSEHSAIFQCLEQDNPIRRIMLTASGGPFYGKKREELQNITPAQALAHPTWSMGRKISIDSASLMNKGLEIIEARWLFNVGAEAIDVVVHPQSIVHSLVEFADGAVKAELGNPDMKVPILYALTYPERLATGTRPLSLPELGKLTFGRADIETFRCLGLAYEALRMGGSAACVLDAADDDAVAAFLEGRIGFLQLPDMLENAMNMFAGVKTGSVEDVLALTEEVHARSGEWLHF